MVTPLGSGVHPHFKLPSAQGWALTRHEHMVGWLEQAEAKRMQYQRRRDGLDPDRMQDVRKALDDLLTEVAVDFELLYDGLPASSLDGQPLATAIRAHLAHPAIPAAAGLCCATKSRPYRSRLLRCRQRWCGSKVFWRAMLDGLPEGCRPPLSLSFCWRRLARCRHQGQRLCLSKLPWQPKTANAVAAAPGRVVASRGAALLLARMPERTSRSASGSAAAADGTFHSSSTSSGERASREAARRDVPAARARACRCTSDPSGATIKGPRMQGSTNGHCCLARADRVAKVVREPARPQAATS